LACPKGYSQTRGRPCGSAGQQARPPPVAEEGRAVLAQQQGASRSAPSERGDHAARVPEGSSPTWGLSEKKTVRWTVFSEERHSRYRAAGGVAVADFLMKRYAKAPVHCF